MHKFLVVSLAAALCAPAFAQKSGSINRNAPTISQTVAMGDAKISLNYTALAYGMGQAFEAAMDKANGAQAREGINTSAKKTPLGDFSTSIALKCGDLNIPAGDYKVSFTINDKAEWHINFTGAQTLTMKLPLMDNKEMPHKRLLMCLYAGDDAGAGAYIAFGNKFAILAFEPGAAGGAKKG
jgi:hypothetical protein